MTCLHTLRRRMNAHQDPPATYAFVAITADNANDEQPFTGGELALLDGVVSVEIGPCDVLIMDGSRYHAVAPLRSLPGENFKSQPLRHSLVHFTKSMHMELEVGKPQRCSCCKLRQRDNATYCHGGTRQVRFGQSYMGLSHGVHRLAICEEFRIQ